MQWGTTQAGAQELNCLSFGYTSNAWGGWDPRRQYSPAARNHLSLSQFATHSLRLICHEKCSVALAENNLHIPSTSFDHVPMVCLEELNKRAKGPACILYFSTFQYTFQ